MQCLPIMFTEPLLHSYSFLITVYEESTEEIHVLMFSEPVRLKETLKKSKILNAYHETTF
jgi:hypothetical protein